MRYDDWLMVLMLVLAGVVMGVSSSDDKPPPTDEVRPWIFTGQGGVGAGAEG